MGEGAGEPRSCVDFQQHLRQIDARQAAGHGVRKAMRLAGSSRRSSPVSTRSSPVVWLDTDTGIAWQVPGDRAECLVEPFGEPGGSLRLCVGTSPVFGTRSHADSHAAPSSKPIRGSAKRRLGTAKTSRRRSAPADARSDTRSKRVDRQRRPWSRGVPRISARNPWAMPRRARRPRPVRRCCRAAPVHLPA